MLRGRTGRDVVGGTPVHSLRATASKISSDWLVKSRSGSFFHHPTVMSAHKQRESPTLHGTSNQIHRLFILVGACGDCCSFLPTPPSQLLSHCIGIQAALMAHPRGSPLPLEMWCDRDRSSLPWCDREETALRCPGTEHGLLESRGSDNDCGQP